MEALASSSIASGLVILSDAALVPWLWAYLLLSSSPKSVHMNWLHYGQRHGKMESWSIDNKGIWGEMLPHVPFITGLFFQIWLLVKTTFTYIIFFSYVLIGGKVIQSWCRYFGNIWDKKGWKEIQRLLWLSWNLWSNSFDPQKDNLWCPGTRNLVAENNLTFHCHFYCHFGKHVMNSEQPVDHIYWSSLHKEPSILQCGEKKWLFIYPKSILQMLMILWWSEIPTKLWVWSPPKGGCQYLKGQK